MEDKFKVDLQLFAEEDDVTKKILDDFEKKMEDKFNAEMEKRQKEFDKKIAEKDAEIEALKKPSETDTSEIDRTIESNEMQKQIDTLQQTVNNVTQKLEKTENLERNRRHHNVE